MGTRHGAGPRRRKRRSWLWALVGALVAVWLGQAFAIRGLFVPFVTAPSAPARPAPWPKGTPVPSFSHIFLILMENRGPSQVLSGVQTPYLEALARRYSVETADYGVRHPSLPNYLALTSGSTDGVTSDCSVCYVHVPNLAGELSRAHVSWDAFLEGLPGRGSLTAVDWPALYAGKHDPFRYYTDVRNASALRDHLQPLTNLWPRLRARTGNAVPRFVWITPDLCHDMHSCPAFAGDLWLRIVLPRILASAAYRDGGVVFITWDEGNGTTPGAPGEGGRVPLIAISPSSRPGGRLSTPVSHYALLRTIQDALGVRCLRHSCTAPALGGLFERHSAGP